MSPAKKSHTGQKSFQTNWVGNNCTSSKEKKTFSYSSPAVLLLFLKVQGSEQQMEKKILKSRKKLISGFASCKIKPSPSQSPDCSFQLRRWHLSEIIIGGAQSDSINKEISCARTSAPGQEKQRGEKGEKASSILTSAAI
jgi:hypothetical protein